MPLNKKLEKEVLWVYDTWLQSYLTGDVATYDSFFDDDYHFIGSTDNEEFLGRKDTTKFFEKTADQLAGKTDIRNETKTIEQFGELVFITHLFDGWFHDGNDWAFYSRFRFTNALRKNKEGWRFVYQHYSTPDTKAQEGESMGYERVSAENQLLREAVKRRTIELEQKNRELEIEAALERIRAQVTGMEKSEELADLVKTIFTELTKLDFAMKWCMINIIDEATADNTIWAVNPDVDKAPQSYRIKFGDWPYHQASFKAYKERKTKFVYIMEGKEKEEFEEFLFKETDAANISPEAKAATMAMRRYVHSYSFSNFGGLQTVSENPLSDESLDILSRFGKVFDLTYTRFNDLKLAEAQAREAQIEASLERVRSRAVAMRHSEELSEAAEVLYNEFLILGLESFSCGYLINDDENEQWKVWLTNPGEAFFKDFWTIPYDADPHLKARYESWKRKEEFHRDVLEGELNRAHHLVISRYAPWKAEILDDLPHQLVLNSAHFSLGHLFVISPDPLSPDMEQAMVRFAGVFDLAYRRFLDLQVAEEQARKIREERDRLEKTLHDLQATQKQLIHSEKMASLGELTAGIAHEIQNPLNFVNNFSEVSNELLDEMNEELDNGDIDEVKAIAHDIKLNLQKINHHGKRADAIVKGMLQHSRKSAGEKTPTDINKLADEYLRLAYHGLRAKDKSFNAKLETSFDLTMKGLEVIPQDIGRVLLNLITNAFYAVHEKKKNVETPYEPAVTISTQQKTDQVTITVKDNGNGIPQNILDKVFQPFFTTKPSGQGTGLGLSLSYDIVKAHGGKIKVNSQVNEGTQFTIILPLKSQH